MDIAPISPPATRSLGASAPVAPTQAVAIEQARALSFLPVAPTTVDLSTQGRFLSLAALFQKKTLELQASVEANTDTPPSLADVSALAQALASAFNALQTAPVENTGLPTGTLGQPSLASQFLQQFGDPADQIQTSLAGIGVQLDTSPFAASALSIDQTALNDAFGRDPAGTSGLLVRTGNAFFGVVTAQVLSNTGNLNLFADDEVSGTDSLGLPDLSATPAPPATQAASNAPNVSAQRLVGDDVRNGNELPDDRADGITLPGDTTAPAAAADAPSGQTLPLPPTVASSAPAALTASANPTAAATLRNATAPDVNQAAVIEAAPASAPVTALAPTAQDRPPVASTAASPSDATSAGAAVLQEARDLAQQLEAERTAARELDERIANASDEVRAALARDVDQRDAARIESLRQDRLQAQQRTEREDGERADALERGQAARANVKSADAPATTQAMVAAQPAVQEVSVKPPLPAPPDQARQLARDPSTAAAIAAYHLSSGPFAAQHVRADMLAPKVKLVQPVASVPKVEPVAALDTAKGGPQYSRP